MELMKVLAARYMRKCRSWLDAVAGAQYGFDLKKREVMPPSPSGHLPHFRENGGGWVGAFPVKLTYATPI